VGGSGEGLLAGATPWTGRRGLRSCLPPWVRACPAACALFGAAASSRGCWARVGGAGRDLAAGGGARPQVSLEEALEGAGFDCGARTVFLAEGVRRRLGWGRDRWGGLGASGPGGQAASGRLPGRWSITAGLCGAGRPGAGCWLGSGCQQLGLPSRPSAGSPRQLWRLRTGPARRRAMLGAGPPRPPSPPPAALPPRPLPSPPPSPS
jgi:hypothetical protein